MLRRPNGKRESAYISRKPIEDSSRAIVSFKGETPFDPPGHYVLYFTAWLVYWVGRGVAKPLVELL